MARIRLVVALIAVALCLLGSRDLRAEASGDLAAARQLGVQEQWAASESLATYWAAFTATGE